MALQSWVIFEELGGFNSSKRISLPTREVYLRGSWEDHRLKSVVGKWYVGFQEGIHGKYRVLKQPSYKLFIKRSLKQTTPQKFINWDQLRPRSAAPVYSLVQGMAKEIRSIRPRRTRKPPQPGTTRWEVSGWRWRCHRVVTWSSCSKPCDPFMWNEWFIHTRTSSGLSLLFYMTT